MGVETPKWGGSSKTGCGFLTLTDRNLTCMHDLISQNSSMQLNLHHCPFLPCEARAYIFCKINSTLCKNRCWFTNTDVETLSLIFSVYFMVVFLRMVLRQQTMKTLRASHVRNCWSATQTQSTIVNFHWYLKS